MEKLRVTLYVRGVKTLVGEEVSGSWSYVVQPRPQGRSGPIPPGVYSDYKVFREGEYRSVLPEDQKAVVELVKAAAEKYGFKLEVVDANKRNVVQKIGDRIRRMGTFPTLVTSTGRRVEGEITEEEVKALISK